MFMVLKLCARTHWGTSIKAEMSLDILNVGGNLCSTPHIVDTTRPASSKEHTVSMLDHTTFLDDVISL